MILLSWLVAVLGGIWMALAHTLGSAARGYGQHARDLDPAHRRDGLGLVALCGAIVSAAAIWWHLGLIGKPLTSLLHGAFGSGAWTIPILLVLLAVRFLRHPDRNADTGRMVIGWTALLVGALGLVHIADGTPSPADGGAAMRAAGGVVGYLASAPLVDLVTKWAAAPVLAAVTGFGLLVITGTPLHQVPGRLADLHGFMWGRTDQDETDLDPDQLADDDGTGDRPQLPRGKTRRLAALGGRRHERPYDTPLLGGSVPRSQGGKGGRGTARAVPAASRCPTGCRSRRGLRRRRECGRLGGGRGVAGVLVRRRRGRGRRGGRSGRGPGGRGGQGPEAGAAHAGRLQRLDLHAAARRAAQAGHRAQGPDQGQRPDGRGPDRGAGPVRGGRPGDRVHPGADGDPVRDRAGPAVKVERVTQRPRTSPTR